MRVQNLERGEINHLLYVEEDHCTDCSCGDVKLFIRELRSQQLQFQVSHYHCMFAGCKCAHLERKSVMKVTVFLRKVRGWGRPEVCKIR